MASKHKQKSVQSSNGNSKVKSGKNQKFQDIPRSKSYSLWTRAVVGLAVAVIAYYIFQQRKDKRFALEKETISHRFQSITCDPGYLSELTRFPACVPKHCGRFVSDSLVTGDEVEQLLTMAKAGFALGGSAGGASIMDLHSGALSHGRAFVNMYKFAEAKNIVTGEPLEVYKKIKSRIIDAISEWFGIDSAAIYLTKPTFFSRITNQTAQTIHDEYWHPHIDKKTYPSFHYTSLLYLSNYGKEFDGGRFLFIESTQRNQTISIEPKRGRISIFTSGSENIHFVEKVQQGIRYAITISFTCDPKSSIMDPQSNHPDGI